MSENQNPIEQKSPLASLKGRTFGWRVLLACICFTLIFSVLLTFVWVSALYRDRLIKAYTSSATMGDNVLSSAVISVDELFRENSYYDIDDDKALIAMLKAYAEATGDRYAEFYTPEEYASMIAESNGDLEGIGVNIIYNEAENAIEIISVMPNSPALSAGLLTGDLITHVSFEEKMVSVAELGYYVAIDAMVGPAGSHAEFKVKRITGETSEILDFSVERAHVEVQTVTGHLVETDKTVALVRISQFDLVTPIQFCRVVDSFLAQGIEKFVFDVRYNPGGDLASIEAILSYFLQEGDLMISTKDKAGLETKDHVTVKNYADDYAKCNVSKEDIGKYRGLKMKILINGDTASAAELFTSVMRDYELAETVGVTTFGKGSMQRIYSLILKNEICGVKMTRCLYFPPSGEGYDGIGIPPDIEVAPDQSLSGISFYKWTDAADNQLQAAVKAFNQ